jgi:hypothetical protein
VFKQNGTDRSPVVSTNHLFVWLSKNIVGGRSPSGGGVPEDRENLVVVGRKI